MKSRQLLCTFSNIISYKSDLTSISNLYTPILTKFFIFENVKNKKDLYITYSIDTTQKFQKLNSTISIHRKKETNTLFSLNAMNKLFTGANDKSYRQIYFTVSETSANALIVFSFVTDFIEEHGEDFGR